MPQSDHNIREEAAGWLLRQRDPARADWIAFTEWLEADPAHNAAYEEVALADDEIDQWIADAPQPAAVANDNMVSVPSTIRKYGMAGIAAAAALAGLIAYPSIVNSSDPYSISTAAGEQRTIALSDGTEIRLNGNSRLTLDRRDARYASLDRGEATFSVTHNAQSPFELHVGQTTLRDVGTVFNVIRTQDQLETSVAEGAVLYDPEGKSIRLDAGKIMQVSTAGSINVDQIDPKSVGAWRHRRLMYRDASLSRVAEDLSRNLGMKIVLAPALDNRHFSGVISLSEDRQHVMARLGSLLDVNAVQDGDIWRLNPRDSAQR